jgi:hypothetical protein
MVSHAVSYKEGLKVLNFVMFSGVLYRSLIMVKTSAGLGQAFDLPGRLAFMAVFKVIGSEPPFRITQETGGAFTLSG